MKPFRQKSKITNRKYFVCFAYKLLFFKNAVLNMQCHPILNIGTKKYTHLEKLHFCAIDVIYLIENQQITKC